jgi:hypothetical protein
MEKQNTFSEFPIVLQPFVRFLNRITSPEGCTAVDARKLKDYNHGLADEVDFYKRRISILEREQKFMRDPERTLICDVLANGQLLPDPKGKRYGNRPNAKSEVPQ